jgi:hypothetical protein
MQSNVDPASGNASTLVMAGFVPAILVFLADMSSKRGCPAQGRA